MVWYNCLWCPNVLSKIDTDSVINLLKIHDLVCLAICRSVLNLHLEIVREVCPSNVRYLIFCPLCNNLAFCTSNFMSFPAVINFQLDFLPKKLYFLFYIFTSYSTFLPFVQHFLLLGEFHVSFSNNYLFKIRPSFSRFPTKTFGNQP